MLIVFDCDGVLVDTEQIANRYLAAALNKAGYAVTYEECRRRFVGGTIESIREAVEAESGLILGTDWPDTIRAGTEHAFEAGIQAIPGVQTVLLSLQQARIPYCVASSGRISKMRKSLSKAGLLHHVEDVLFSAEMVARGKPAPDLFLHAASEMGTSPEDSIVIEDSLPGVIAGTAAGMRVLAYAADPFAKAEEMRDAGAELFDDMRMLPRMIAEIYAG